MAVEEPVQTALYDEEKFRHFSDVDSEEHELAPSPVRSRLRNVIVAVSGVVILALVAYITISRWPVSRLSLRFDQCGTTAAEAKARDCVFETTGFCWLPKECHDPDTEEEFLEFIASNDLKLYWDLNYTKEVSIDEVRKGDGPGFYVREQYHLTHCLFLIKKLHRALTTGKTVDGLIKPLSHTEHCVGQLLQPPGFRKDDIQFSYTKFPYCGRAGGYNVHWRKQGLWTDY